MMARRKLLVALLCPLFVMGSLLLIQGCGGGGQTEQAAEEATEEATKAVTEEASKPADEMKQKLESHTEELALAAYTCPMHPEACSLEPGTCGACGMDLEETMAMYTCTMCADVHSAAPGQCSHCGMDLVLRPMPE